MPGSVEGLFFDQPAPVLYRWQGGSGNLINSLLWPEDFHADTAATRSFVYRLYTATIEQAFLAPLRAYCDRNGLALTGHELLPHVASFALNAASPASTRAWRWRSISSGWTAGAT